jgi:hypothetical protein
MPLSSNITPEPNPPLTRERVVAIREMYAEGFTVARILAHCQTSLGTLYACLDGAPFGLDGEQWPTMPRRRQTLHQKRRALKADAVSLTNRLTRTAERQVRDIEMRLSARAISPTDRERDVRMLGILTRTLRDLQVLHRALPPAGDAESVNYDELPADIDDLRQELTRKFQAMAASADLTQAPDENA